MLRVVYSNRTEELVGALIERLEAERALPGADAFQPVTIVVPNRNMATYLKFELARRRGIAANLVFDFPGRFVRRCFAGPDGARQMEPVNRGWLQVILLELLGRPDVVSQPGLEPVADYLDAASDEASRALRAFQLASQLARLFDHYERSRTRMLDLWSGAPTLDSGPFHRAEVWQRLLWLELFGEDGLVDEISERDDAPRLVRLSHVFDAAEVDSASAPARVHVFGLSYAAPVYYTAFARLSERCEVQFYALSPCVEFVEDMPLGWGPSPRDPIASRSRAQGRLVFEREEDWWSDEGAHTALRLWGRPGRDNIRLLNLHTDCQFEGRFVDPTAERDSVLARLQRDIARRQPERPEPGTGTDDSIVIYDAPTIHREVEAVANEIWHLAEEHARDGTPLHLNEIAVVVAERQREAYQARIAAVFRDMADLPHNMVDIRATSARRLLEACELLYALPFGDFGRREMLRLLTHPNFMAAAPHADPATWIRWADELGVRYGADHEDHEGTYIEREVLHWDQALKRLTLGAFMAGSRSGDARVFSPIVDDQTSAFLPHELDRERLGAAATLIARVRSLVGDARHARSERMSMRQWSVWFSTMLATYLAPETEDDEYDVLRMTRALSQLAEYDVLETEIPYAVAHQFVRSALGGLEVARGQYLAHGVVVSTLLPMRPIPFRYVFVLGLGEHNFPAQDPNDPIDLRGAQWRPGDVRGRKRDEYVFLQTLLSARERIYLSYVGRDDQTGDELQPSSVLRELRFILERGYVDPEAFEARNIVRHPLRRYDERYFGEVAGDASPLRFPPSLGADARPEAHALALRAELLDWCERNLVEFPSDPEALESLGTQEYARVAELLRLPPAEPPGLSRARSVEVPLSLLRRFLQSPLQARASLHLAADRRADSGGDDDEVFESDALSRTVLLRRVMADGLLAGQSAPEQVWETYEREAFREELAGRMPTGVFSSFADAEHARILEAWSVNLGRLSLGDDARVERLGFARAPEHAHITDLEDAIRLECTLPGRDTPVEVRVVGMTSLLLAARSCLVTFRAADADSSWNRSSERHFVPGFLDVVLMAAAAQRPDEAPARVALVPGSVTRPNEWVRSFSPLGVAAARAYLTGLVEDLYSDRAPYALPIEAVCEFRHERNKKTFTRLVEGLRWDKSPFVSFRNGPLRQPERYAPPDDFETMIQRRFGLFFDHRPETGDMG